MINAATDFAKDKSESTSIQDDQLDNEGSGSDGPGIDDRDPFLSGEAYRGKKRRKGRVENEEIKMLRESLESKWEKDREEEAAAREEVKQHRVAMFDFLKQQQSIMSAVVDVFKDIAKR